MSIRNSARCAACKYLRRRCGEDCVLAPYFPPEHPERFACVHRIYGAGNVARMLQHIPVEQRRHSAESIMVEAYARVQNPVYGIAGIIHNLQQQIQSFKWELARTHVQIPIHASSSNATATQGEPSLNHHPLRHHNEVGEEIVLPIGSDIVGGGASESAGFMHHHEQMNQSFWISPLGSQTPYDLPLSRCQSIHQNKDM